MGRNHFHCFPTWIFSVYVMGGKRKWNFNRHQVMTFLFILTLESKKTLLSLYQQLSTIVWICSSRNASPLSKQFNHLKQWKYLWKNTEISQFSTRDNHIFISVGILCSSSFPINSKTHRKSSYVWRVFPFTLNLIAFTFFSWMSTPRHHFLY